MYAPDMVPLFHNATNPSPLNAPMQCATHIVCPCKWHTTFWGGGQRVRTWSPPASLSPVAGKVFEQGMHHGPLIGTLSNLR